MAIGGPVEPGGAFDPDEIAEEYRVLHTEAHGRWRREVNYDSQTGYAT